MAEAPNWARVEEDWSASTPPVKKPVSRTMGMEPTPMESSLSEDVGGIEGPADDVGDGPCGEEGVLLQGENNLFRGSVDGRL